MEGRHIEALRVVPSSKVTWTIHNFSTLNTQKHYSDIFLVDGSQWKLLIYPKGNAVSQLSIYLAVADSESLPHEWSRTAKFSISVIDQLHNKSTVTKEADHKFNAKESDWGFTSFFPLSKLHDLDKGYIVNDVCIIEADVTLRAAVPKTEGVSITSLHTDVKEYPNSYAFVVEIPGLTLSDIKVQLVDNDKALFVSGEQKREKEEGVTYVRAERKFGSFSRKFVLPDNMNTDAISAIYKDGVLTLTVGKIEDKKPKTIQVKLG
ncbi:MATH domain and coiled-coil domain-containing protein At3g58270-like [Tasmannia lanceolata]|uniref:MATH domain and coiled-coil domain-containing protein At3g58270-like n=1 Tax=Tasmannia lanceolata TaxID=3420 RepID=UPI0040630AB9